jgi:hypothetical protein
MCTQQCNDEWLRHVALCYENAPIKKSNEYMISRHHAYPTACRTDDDESRSERVNQFSFLLEILIGQWINRDFSAFSRFRLARVLGEHDKIRWLQAWEYAPYRIRAYFFRVQIMDRNAPGNPEQPNSYLFSSDGWDVFWIIVFSWRYEWCEHAHSSFSQYQSSCMIYT